MSAKPVHLPLELSLLGLLALLWGSSFLFINIALTGLPPITLVAVRVVSACVFLWVVVALRAAPLPRSPAMWGHIAVHALIGNLGPWLLLAWGQQTVETALASVLNSTSPIFVVLYSVLLGTAVSGRRIAGAALGFAGVILIVGTGALETLGQDLVPELAVLAGAAGYAAAALYGRHFAALDPAVTAACALTLSAIAVVPAALAFDEPWTLRPSATALTAALVLGIFATGVAQILWFRLVRTLGALGTSSQAYLRAGVGVALGVIILDDVITLPVAVGIVVAVVGVALINTPDHIRLPFSRRPVDAKERS